jgi:hypothetical protein
MTIMIATYTAPCPEAGWEPAKHCRVSDLYVDGVPITFPRRASPHRRRLLDLHAARLYEGARPPKRLVEFDRAVPGASAGLTIAEEV